MLTRFDKILLSTFGAVAMMTVGLVVGASGQAPQQPRREVKIVVCVGEPDTDGPCMQKPQAATGQGFEIKAASQCGWHHCVYMQRWK